MGGWTHCFTILFSYWFSITTIENPIVPNQKKNGSATPILFLFIWGSSKGLVPYIWYHMTPLWSCYSFFDGLKAMNELKRCARLVKSYLGSSKRTPPLTWSSKWKTWLRASHLPSRKLTKLWKSMCFSLGNDPWPCAAWKLDPCWGLISFIWGGAECHETLPCVCVCYLLLG